MYLSIQVELIFSLWKWMKPSRRWCLNSVTQRRERERERERGRNKNKNKFRLTQFVLKSCMYFSLVKSDASIECVGATKQLFKPGSVSVRPSRRLLPLPDSIQCPPLIMDTKIASMSPFYKTPFNAIQNQWPGFINSRFHHFILLYMVHI